MRHPSINGTAVNNNGALWFEKIKKMTEGHYNLFLYFISSKRWIMWYTFDNKDF